MKFEFIFVDHRFLLLPLQLNKFSKRKIKLAKEKSSLLDRTYNAGSFSGRDSILTSNS